MKAYIWGVLLALDGGVYDFICYLFEIFYYLCGLQVFNDSDYNVLVQRIYIILGLIMMFVLAYSLLKAVINPDEFAKGETSFPKLIQNVVVSLAIIVFLPTAFTAAFSIQNSLLNYDTIPKLILGTGTSGTTGPSIGADGVQNVSGGRAIAFYTFKAFLFPDLGSGELTCSYDDPDKCRDQIHGNGATGSTNGPLLTERDKAVLEGKNSFTIYGNYSESVRDHKLTYYYLISTVAGLYIAYIMLNFCFDMALRVIKIAFYQIIAPIPVICRIIPGGKLKDVFSKWLKQVVSLFIEVFVRVAALSFGVYLIKIVIQKFESGLPGIDMLTGFGQKSIVLALLIMSIVMFIKQIPKIIGDMFGLDTGGMKLGLMDKLAAGGALAAGAFLGGGLGSLGRNMVGQFANKKNWLNKDGKLTAGSVLKNVGSGVKTGIAGGVSGARRGFSAGKGAKNLADMRKAAGSAVAGASAAKAKRAAYKASHAGNGYFGTMWNVAKGHVTDTAQSVGEYFGLNNVDDLISDNKLIDDIASKKKAVATSVESVIDKEASKAKSDFKVGSFSATELRQKMLDIENAKAGTLKDAAGNVVTVSQAQQIYDEYRYAFSQAAQNIAFSSKANFEKLATSDKDLYVKLFDAQAKAEAFRATVSENIGQSYLQEAGFTAEYLKGDMKVDVKGDPLKNVGDNLDVARARNDMEIANRQKQDQSKGSNV